MAGRPTTYSEAIGNAICKEVERGNPFSVACRLCGVPLSTFNGWREQKPQFSDAIHAAEARAQALMVNAIVSNAVAGDTKAAIFYLTHRHGDEWKPPKERQEISGPEGKDLTVKVVKGVSLEDI